AGLLSTKRPSAADWRTHAGPGGGRIAGTGLCLLFVQQQLEDHAGGVRCMDAAAEGDRRQRVVAAARQWDGGTQFEEKGVGAGGRSKASGICSAHEARGSRGAASAG